MITCYSADSEIHGVPGMVLVSRLRCEHGERPVDYEPGVWLASGPCFFTADEALRLIQQEENPWLSS